MSLHKFTVQEAQNAALGQAGYKIIDQAGTADTGAAAAGVEYVAVTILESTDAIITTTSNDTDKFPNLSSQPVPAGTTIFGRWSQVTIGGTASSAICYRG